MTRKPSLENSWVFLYLLKQFKSWRQASEAQTPLLTPERILVEVTPYESSQLEIRRDEIQL